MNCKYPLVNVYITMENPPIFHGKSTISTGPFSIANCLLGRGYFLRYGDGRLMGEETEGALQ